MHFRCSYGPADLRCDQRFQDMVCLDGTDGLCLDFSRFDATKPLDPTGIARSTRSTHPASLTSSAPA